MSDAEVTVVIALKALRDAKSRLVGVDGTDRARLTLAMAADTVAAASAHTVLVVGAEPAELHPLADLGAEVTDDGGAHDLNEALEHAELLARAKNPDGVVAALQADLPALRPESLAAAIGEAAGDRAFCADRHGTGTTLLLSAAGQDLRPRFGTDSAIAHAESGAIALKAPNRLRTDVDTAQDLHHARTLGLGPHTTRVLRRLRTFTVPTPRGSPRDGR